ncbi:hypothetical protein F5X96DRAFT_531532 [Biscogniauxia mediterranea]|nr:hypothetical protein F5X96DRAFT_531532 [Biscogniauxia mediterranea]
MGQNVSQPNEYGIDGAPLEGSSMRRRSRWGGSPRPLSTSTSPGYFPRLSKRSSVSSQSSSSTTQQQHESPSSSSSSSSSPSPSLSSSPSSSKPASLIGIGSNYPLPALDREYAKPTGELDVAAQLAKKPAYWSAQGWVHRAATSEPAPRVEDPETRARKFAEAKRDLLASAGRL